MQGPTVAVAGAVGAGWGVNGANGATGTGVVVASG